MKNSHALLEKYSNNISFWKILKNVSEEFKEAKILPVSEKQWIDLHYCKFYLGVNNKASNIACRVELGEHKKLNMASTGGNPLCIHL